jgi:hypothetical protein
MAGPKRVWKFHNEPQHEWLFTGVGSPAPAPKAEHQNEAPQPFTKT